MKEKIMLQLNPKFQELLFTQFIKKFGIKKCCSLIKKNHAMLYHYRNNRIKLVPKIIIKKVCNLLNLSNKFKSYIIKEISFSESINKILLEGRKIRKSKLNQYKQEIPKINDIIEENYLNLEKWFKKYIKLINFGARQFKKIKKDKEKIKLAYTCYSNSKKKEFINYLPIKIKIDEEFLYFLGLWCGDRVGRGRFGIANKEKVLNLATKKYLIRLYQKPNLILYINKNLKIPKLNYIDGIYIIKAKTKIKGYCISVYSRNSILFRFFDYLLLNLDLFLSKIDKKEIFFAGLFDAEGNISLEDSYFRWACKNKTMVEIYKKYLKEMNLFNRYDNCCLITNNKRQFWNKVYPYIKHPAKINRANLVCSNEGFLEQKYKTILKTIKYNPGIKQKQLSKHLKRKKSYAYLKFLENLNYVQCKNYPKMHYITNKGAKEINIAQESEWNRDNSD